MLDERPEWLSRWPAVYCVLYLRTSFDSSVPIAVMLLDISSDRLYYAFREDLSTVADKESAAILAGIRAELPNWTKERGATAVFLMLLDRLSNALAVSIPREVSLGGDLIDAAEILLAQEIHNVIPAL